MESMPSYLIFLALLSFLVIATSAGPQAIPLLLTIPFPSFGAQFLEGATLAQHWINNSTQILPGHALEFLRVDTNCDGSVASRKLEFLSNACPVQQKFAGVVHASCSADVVTLVEKLTENGIKTPLVSGSAFKRFENRPRTLFFGPALQDLTEPNLEFLRTFQIDRLASLQAYPLFSPLVGRVSEVGVRLMHSVELSEAVQSDPCARRKATLDFARRVVSLNVPVVFISGYPATGAELLCSMAKAKKEANSTSAVQYLSHRGMKTEWMRQLAVADSLCSLEEVNEEITTYWAIGAEFSLDSPEFARTLQFSADLNFTDALVKVQELRQPLSNTIFDAVIAYALALDSYIGVGGELNDLFDSQNETAADLLYSLLANVSFVGVSGQIGGGVHEERQKLFVGDTFCGLLEEAGKLNTTCSSYSFSTLLDNFFTPRRLEPVGILIPSLDHGFREFVAQVFAQINNNDQLLPWFELRPLSHLISCVKILSTEGIISHFVVDDAGIPLDETVLQLPSIGIVVPRVECVSFVSDLANLQMQEMGSRPKMISAHLERSASSFGGFMHPSSENSSFDLNLLPPISIMNDAIVALLSHFGWHRVSVLSGFPVDDTNLHKFLSSLSARNHIQLVLNRVILSTGDFSGDFAAMLELVQELKSRNGKIIVVYLPEFSETFLTLACALRKKDMTLENGYVILTVSFSGNLREYISTNTITCHGANVTVSNSSSDSGVFEGLLVVSPQTLARKPSDYVLSTGVRMDEWLKGVDHLSEQVQEQLALLHDGIFLLAMSLDRFVRQEGLAAFAKFVRHNDAAVQAKVDYLLLHSNFTSGATGPVAFEKNGNRRGMGIELHQLHGGKWELNLLCNASACLQESPLYFPGGKIPSPGANPDTGSVPTWVIILMAALVCLVVVLILWALWHKRMVRTMQRMRDVALAANKAKSSFLRSMTHDIRSPLNAAMGLTELLTDTPLTSQQEDYLGGISKSLAHLLGVLSGILDLSRIESGRFLLMYEQFSLERCVGRSLELSCMSVNIQKRSAVDCFFVIADSVPKTVFGDEGRLLQVLVNLLVNALKFTDSGSVVVKVSTLTPGSTFGSCEWSEIVNTTEEEKQGCRKAIEQFRWSEQTQDSQVVLLFQVEDTGMGIPESEQHAIFHTFYQVDGSSIRQQQIGSGLGLSICFEMSQLMGGRLWLKSSSAGEGSTFAFSVVLGLEKPEKASPPRSRSQSGADSSSTRSSRSSSPAAEREGEANAHPFVIESDATLNDLSRLFKGKRVIVAFSTQAGRRSIAGMLKNVGATVFRISSAAGVYNRLSKHGEMLDDLLIMEHPFQDFFSHVAPVLLQPDSPKLVLVSRTMSQDGLDLPKLEALSSDLPGSLVHITQPVLPEVLLHACAQLLGVFLEGSLPVSPPSRVSQPPELPKSQPSPQSEFRRLRTLSSSSPLEAVRRLRRPLQLLIVEDNELNSRVLALFLRRVLPDAGINIAENGQVGLDFLRRNFVDLAFVDVLMPVRDGISCVRALCSEQGKRERPVLVALTANATVEDRVQCLRCGFNDFQTKPVSMAVIERVLEHWMPTILKRQERLLEKTDCETARRLLSLLKK